MTEMKSLTLNDKKYDCFVDSVARDLAAATAIIKSVEGESITASDAADNKIYGLRVYGETTQNGTPQPDNPIDLVSSADEGGLSVLVCGKNVCDISQLKLGEPSHMSRTGTGFAFTRGTFVGGTYASFTMPIPKGKTLTFSCQGSVYQPTLIIYKDVIYGTQLISAVGTGILTYTATEDIRSAVFAVIINSQHPNGVFSNIQIEFSPTATTYEAYKGQMLTVFTPDGLRGVPVANGGNFTDANDQQWVCDEIDLERGVYVKRVGKYTVSDSSDETWAISSVQSVPGATRFDISTRAPKAGQQKCLCNAYKGVVFADADKETCWCSDEATSNTLQFRISTTKVATVDELKNYVRNNPVDVVYVLANPVEVPLSAEEISTYNNLRTYRENTTVFNDGLAYMELDYAMDAKTYIDHVLGVAAMRLTEVNLPASQWTGSDSLYSQVVTISGITEYSKVDLLPSVEQLAIFHNKDVAFVTENEGGVVTVYAIGDKPTQDYTMQVQITEVEV